MKSLPILLTLLFAFFALPSVMAQEQQIVDETVARVNSDIITRSALLKAEEKFKQELQQSYPNDPAKQKEEFQRVSILETLIRERLIRQRAAELAVDAEVEINQRILEIAKDSGIPSLKEFEEALRRQGIEPDELRENIRLQVQQRAVLSQDVYFPIFNRLTLIEKRQWYDQHSQEFPLPGEIKISEIFIGTTDRSVAEAEALAKQAVAEARSGKPFAEVVKAYSDPTRASVAKGGELPPFRPNEIIEYLKVIVDKMKVDDISDAIKTDKGFQIIQLNLYRSDSVQEYSSVEEEVAQRLASEKAATEITEYYKKLRDKAYIRIADNYKQTVEAAPSN